MTNMRVKFASVICMFDFNAYEYLQYFESINKMERRPLNYWPMSFYKGKLLFGEISSDLLFYEKISPIS